MSDLIDRQAAMDALIERDPSGLDSVLNIIRGLADARSEVTEEDVIEYCRKRCLCIVDSALFKNYEFTQPDPWIPCRERQNIYDPVDLVKDLSDKIGIDQLYTIVVDMYGKGALIDSEKRKKGKWKKAYLDHEAMSKRPSFLYCSICNQCIIYPTNYCPNCGAEMRSDQSV